MKLKIKRSPARSGDGSPAAMPDASSRVRRPAANAAPAMPGTLHRAYVGGYAPSMDDDQAVEAEEQPSKGAARLRALRELLRSRGGRILVGGVVCFGVGAVAATVFGMRSWLTHDDRFELNSSADIGIVGTQHVTRAQVLSVFGADLERNIFKVPLVERRADLERLPWVEHATVMRLLPDKLRVAVTERTPVAFARQGSTIGLVDANGVLLDMPESAAGEPGYSFPVLTGLLAADTANQRTAKMDVYKRFIAEINAGGEKLSQKISEVDVSNPEDVRAVVAGSGSDVIVHFGDEDFLNRFHHFLSHLDEWRRQYPKLSAADMRYERQVVLEMQGSSTAASGAPAPAAINMAAAPAVPATAGNETASHAAVVPVPAHATATVPAAHHVAAAVHARTGNAQQSAANARTFAALAAARKLHATHLQKREQAHR